MATSAWSSQLLETTNFLYLSKKWKDNIVRQSVSTMDDIDGEDVMTTVIH